MQLSTLKTNNLPLSFAQPPPWKGQRCVICAFRPDESFTVFLKSVCFSFRVVGFSLQQTANPEYYRHVPHGLIWEYFFQNAAEFIKSKTELAYILVDMSLPSISVFQLSGTT